MWFKDITGVNTLALEMSSGFKILKESKDNIEFRIYSPKEIDRVSINRKNDLFEILFFKKDKLCGYKSKVKKENLIDELEIATETFFSF